LFLVVCRDLSYAQKTHAEADLIRAKNETEMTKVLDKSVGNEAAAIKMLDKVVDICGNLQEENKKLEAEKEEAKASALAAHQTTPRSNGKGKTKKSAAAVSFAAAVAPPSSTKSKKRTAEDLGGETESDEPCFKPGQIVKVVGGKEKSHYGKRCVVIACNKQWCFYRFLEESDNSDPDSKCPRLRKLVENFELDTEYRM